MQVEVREVPVARCSAPLGGGVMFVVLLYGKTTHRHAPGSGHTGRGQSPVYGARGSLWQETQEGVEKVSSTKKHTVPRATTAQSAPQLGTTKVNSIIFGCVTCVV